LVLVIKSSGLMIFSLADKKAYEVDYPAGVISNLEIKDRSNLILWWKAVKKKFELRRGKILIVMDDSVCFQKTIQNDAEAEGFWSELPISPDLLVKKVISINGKRIAAAVNKDLYRYMVRTFKGGTVEAVVPDRCLFTGGPGLWNWDAAERLVKIKIEPHWNLEETDEGDTGVGGKLWLVGGIFALLVVLGVVAAVATVKLRVNSYPVPARATTAPVPTEVIPTPTITPSADIERAEVGVMVLNGTNVQGLAAGVGERLIQSGYILTETANYQTKNSGKTLIKYLPGYESQAREIHEIVLEEYQTATPEADPELTEVHVRVILGGEGL